MAPAQSVDTPVIVEAKPQAGGLARLIASVEELCANDDATMVEAALLLIEDLLPEQVRDGFAADASDMIEDQRTEQVPSSEIARRLRCWVVGTIVQSEESCRE